MKKIQDSKAIQGICTNSECPLAEAEEIIDIEDGNPECPECGKLLKPLNQPIGSSSNRLLFIIIGIILVLLLASLFFFLSKEPPSDQDNIPSIKWPVASSNQCAPGTVLVNSGVFSIDNTYNNFLKKYKQKYARQQGVNLTQQPLEIAIKRAVCLQQNEVTVAEFKQFLDSTSAFLDPARIKVIKSKIGEQPGRLPVENISKNDADAYARWLTAQNQYVWKLPRLGQWIAAIKLYGEHSPVTDTLNNQPAPIKTVSTGKAANLLGNLREWSSDSCPGGRFQLLGRNYMSVNNMDMAYCQLQDMGSPGIGFRLMYYLDGAK